MKNFISLFVFLPAFLMLTLDEGTFAEGIYNKSFGTIATFVLMGIAVNYLFHFSKVKNDGWKVWGWFTIIIGLGLSVATLF